MKNKEVVSAIVGGTFFAIPYLGLSITAFPAIVIGCAAFGASELLLSGFGSSEKLKDTDLPLYRKLMDAKKKNKEIMEMIPKVESSKTRTNLEEINETVAKIINTVEGNPKKAKKIDNFFEYYLPILLKIVKRYDEVENQKLTSEEGKSFMKKADKMIDDTNNAFKSILSSLYSNDIMDADADMKVYDMMLKADGIVDDNPIMKGSDVDE